MNPLRDPRDKRLPRIAGPSGIVIFGVTGDLARKKLMPAIYDLATPRAAAAGLRPGRFRAGATGRTRTFAKIVHDAVREHSRTPFSEDVCGTGRGFRFVQGAFDYDDAFDTLAQTLLDLDRVRGTGATTRSTSPIPPGAFPVVLKQLKRSGCVNRTARSGAGSSSRSPSGTT